MIIMINPEYKTYCNYTNSFSTIPLYMAFDEDLFTPISLFKKLESLSPTFMLESVGNPENQGRFTYIGIEGKPIELEGTNSLEGIEALAKDLNAPDIPGLPPFNCGLIGYISYESIEDFLPINIEKKSSIPKSQVLFAKTLLIMDHLTHRIFIVYNAEKSKGFEDEYQIAQHTLENIYRLLYSDFSYEPDPTCNSGTMKITSNITKEKYMDNVLRAKQYIKEGEIFQVVLSQKFKAKTTLDPFEVYRNLRRENPSPYLSYIRFGDIITICSSPELLVKNIDGKVETSPIAGTRPILLDGKDDERAADLLQDEKELSEHLMLVDLGRNDLGKISKPGTVLVDDFCKVKKYSKVMHLVSNVQGEAKDVLKPLDPIRATFPAGTVSGAPKIRAMEIIDELEPDNRDLYAGTLFYLNSNGNLNSCIAIRTMVIRNGEVTIQAGGGVVHDSDPLTEYHESLNKAKALFKALEKTHKGDVEYDFSY